MVAAGACGGDRRGAGCDRPRRRLPGEPRPAHARALPGRPGGGRARAGAARRRVRGRDARRRLVDRLGDAGALPAHPRRPGLDDADQGHAPRRLDRAHRRERQGPGRARDDRRPRAKRPRPRVRPRIGAGEHVPRGAADGGRPPPRLDRRGAPAARRRHRRAPARDVPRRVDHGRTEAGGDRAHRPARARRPGRLDGGDRPRPPQRRPRPGAHDPHVRDRGRARSTSGSAAGSCGTPTPARRSRSRS